MEKEDKGLTGWVLALSLFVSAPAWATGTVLSGMFDGSGPSLDPLVPEHACSDSPSTYVQSKFEVSASGVYRLHDVLGVLSNDGGVDIVAVVYQSGFDASNPEMNLIAVAGEPDFESDIEVNLSAGLEYVLVVQQSCPGNAEAPWAVSFTGPGGVSSDDLAAVPDFTSGVFADDDPIIDTQVFWDGWYGGPGRYREFGPTQVSHGGTYFFAGTSLESLCFMVYTAPFNPDDLWANLVAANGGWGTVPLDAGQDYYFVVQQCYGNKDEYFYVLAPPAPFRINAGLTDSWYNPDTAGQGFFLDVFEQRNEVFLGWFTYASDPPADDVFAHRWITALGPFSGDSAELFVEWAAGGAFDAADPVPEQYQQGTMELEFTDCASGQVTISWDSEGEHSATRVIPIQRSSNDSVPLCESLYRGPGMPGPL